VQSLLASALTFLAGCGTALERGLIYHPSTTLAGTPAAFGLPYEDVEVTTADGVSIHGWLLPGPRPATLLYCHGNAGNISHRLPKLEAFNRLGLSILIFDYRGYGRSAGSPDEAGTYADARAMREWLRARDAGPMVYFGESLGAAVATALAAEDPPAALVLEAPFESVPAMASATVPGAGWLFRTRYDTLGTVGRVEAPLLVLHGDADEVVPYRQGRAVFDAAAAPKVFVTIPGARHNDAHEAGGEVYWEGVDGVPDRPPPRAVTAGGPRATGRG
jgi:fermentation-respiration switch protein FrsA (DUF1100 family)